MLNIFVFMTLILLQKVTLKKFFSNIDEITDLIKEKMDETGIKLLWNTANMFSNPRYVNGAASTNNANVYAIAAAQVKKV